MFADTEDVESISAGAKNVTDVNFNTTKRKKSGLSEKRIFALLVIPFMFLGFHIFSPNFILYTPDYECRDLQSEVINDTQSLNENATLSRNSQCHVYSQHAHGDSDFLQPCRNGWDYDLSGGQTVVTEFNLVCDGAWKRPLLTSLFMVGVLFGSVVGGFLSDRIGRREVLRFSFLLCGLSVLAISFVTSYAAFAVVHFGSGFLHVIVYYACYILAQEHVSEKRRNQAALIINLSFGAGFLLLPLLAHLIRDWRWLLRTPSIAVLVYMPLFWWLIPESPTWVVNRRKEDDEDFEKEQLDSVSVVDDAEEKDEEAKFEENVTASTLCSNPVLRTRVLICCFLWNVVFLAYYTLNLNSSNLGGNIYINCALAASVDVVSYFFMAFLLSKLGRRGSSVVCYLLSGSLCLAAPSFREVHNIVGIVCSMSGKFFATISTGIIVLYTGEMFPTLLRNTSVGISSMSARFASAAAPFLVFTGEVVNLSIPFYVMGSMSLFGAGLVLILPETSNILLPDSVQDAVNLDRGRKIFSSIRLQKRDKEKAIGVNDC